MLHLKYLLSHRFRMKDLGPNTQFHGLKLDQLLGECLFIQKKYIDDLIGFANLSDAKPMDTPLKMNVKYSKDSSDTVEDPQIYRQIVVG